MIELLNLVTLFLAQTGEAATGEAVAAAGTINFHVGMAAVGSAIGVGLVGMKASEAVGRNPGAATPILVQSILAMAFAEGITFFAIFLV